MNWNTLQKKDVMKALVVIMSEYRDRGIIKWAPFDALISYQDILSDMRYNRNKADKPVLSDDQYDKLNRVVNDAIVHQKVVHVTYYEDGYFKIIFGVIKAYDMINNSLIFKEGFDIKTQQIMDVYTEIVNE